MTQFLYFEPMTEGFSAAWAQAVLASAQSNPKIERVTLCGTHVLFDRLSDEVDRSNVDFVPIEEVEANYLLTGSALARSWKQWTKIRTLIREHRPTICFMPFFDQIAMWASLDRRKIGARVSGNIFKAPNEFGIKRRLKFRANKYLRWATYFCSIRSEVPVLFTLDEMMLDLKWNRMTNRFRLLRDPAPDRNLFDDCSTNERKDGRRVALFFGHISKRKGVFNILSALSKISEQDQKNLVVRISGRVKPEQFETLERAIAKARQDAPQIVIELNNKFLSEDEIAQEVTDASVVLMPYEDHVGSSGVLYWAAMAKRPVIAQNTRLIGYLVTRYGLGQAVDVWSDDALAQALVRTVPISEERAEQFVDGHTYEALSNRILTELLA